MTAPLHSLAVPSLFPAQWCKSCAHQLLALWISQHPETARVGACSPLQPAELGRWVPAPATSQGVTQVPWPQAAPSRDKHPAVPGTRLHPAPLPVHLMPHTETPMPHGGVHTPACPMYPGKVPSQSHVSPARETLHAPQCPAGITTIQGPSFSVHSWPRAASTRCHVHVEWCRNAVQELDTVPAPGGFMGMTISTPMMALGKKWIKTLLLAGSLLFIPELIFSSIPLGLGDHLRSLPCLSSLKLSGGGRQECDLWLSGTL